MIKWFKKKLMKWKRMKFKKKVVVSCIAFIVLYTIIQTYLSYVLKVELSPTLTTCVYAFFGTELAAMAFIQISETKNTNKQEINNGGGNG